MRPAGAEAERLGELRELLSRTSAPLRSARRGSTTSATTRRTTPSYASSSGSSSSPPSWRKPVVVHTRAADEHTLEALRGFAGTVILHCFSSPPLLDAALERRYYVSFAGNVTYPKAGDLRECAARVPADRILAETDSPYLAPQPLRGRPNEPAHVVHTVRALADARGEDADELAAQIDANASAAFSLP